MSFLLFARILALTFIVSTAVASPKVLAASLERVITSPDVTNRTAISQPPVGKRNSLPSRLSNQFWFYRASFSLGSPNQQLNAILDTGSSDLWVHGPSDAFCLENHLSNASGQFSCNDSGIFFPNKSTTFDYWNPDFSIVYGDGSYSRGVFGTETLTINNVAVKNLGFAVSTDSDSPQSVFGIGLVGNEATLNTYDNLPVLLYKQGIIGWPSYSLWLNGADAEAGVVLFGGVDHSKYQGQLVTVPIYNRFSSFNVTVPQEFTVQFSEIAVYPKSCAKPRLVNSQPLVGLLDSGTSLTYLPAKVVDALILEFGLVYSKQASNYILPCEYMASSPMAVTYTIGSQKIRVTLGDLAVRAYGADNNPLFYPSGASACALGVVKSPNDLCILGDTFLRSAYVVYDIGNYQISIGQARKDVAVPNIEDIQSNRVPGAISANLYNYSPVDACVSTPITGPVISIESTTIITSTITISHTVSSPSGN